MVNSQSNCSPGAASAETQAVTWTWRCDDDDDHEDGGGGGGDHEDDLEDHLSGGGSDKVGEHPPECVAT